MAAPRSATLKPAPLAAAPNPGAFIQTPRSPTDAPVSPIVPTGTPSTPRPVDRAVVPRPGLGRPMPAAKPEPPPLFENDEPEPPPIEDFPPPPVVVETEVDDSPPPPPAQRREFVPKPMPSVAADLSPAQRAVAQRLAVLHQLVASDSGMEFMRRIAETNHPAFEQLSEAWCLDIPF